MEVFFLFVMSSKICKVLIWPTTFRLRLMSPKVGFPFVAMCWVFPRQIRRGDYVQVYVYAVRNAFGFTAR